MKRGKMRQLLKTIPYSPYLKRPRRVDKLTDGRMRRVLTRIIVVSGIDIASAFQVEEANSSQEESRKQPAPKLLQAL